ncbi:sulfotransferase family protein [Kibdelosporangium persicum]|uniref:Lysine biosynthesis protein LysW n=1 Tax=Kibdelosporangium persicum TaxID=2698649 RepID=A0ABX2FIX2_9PSEU|nr:sulfotransferase family protein [Kibdelosporangium persicum]NRN70678.1 Lysine biosynthesis protein LysW [Kibdelosporangium persicum]
MTRAGNRRILALWSAPRSRSTAFLRMIVERGDFEVLHEPFSGLADFGQAVVAGTTVVTEHDLIAAIRSRAGHGPVFFKDTTDFHYPGLLADDEFLREATHTFLIRDPAEVIASHYALNPDVRLEDIGFGRLSEIYDAVAAQTGEPPVLITAEDLVERPAETVRAYCDAIGIPFVASALAWRPGVLNEWRSAQRWHESTSRTNGFTGTRASYPDTVTNNPVLAGFLEHHRPYYEKLRQRALPVPG